MLTVGQDLPRNGGEAMLDGLCFHRANYAQSNRRSNQTTQMLEKKYIDCAHARKAELAGSAAKYGRKMPKWQQEVCQTESFFHHHQERPTLRTAGAIRHMISEKGVRQAIQFFACFRCIIRSGDKRHRRMR